MTISPENLEDRLRRVLHEQAETLQVHPANWQGEAGTVARKRPRWSPPSGVLAVGFCTAIALVIVVGALALMDHNRGQTKAGAGVGRQPRLAATPSGPPDCNAAGINAQLLREGTCVINGTSIVVVVNRTSTLHLRSLDANYVGIHRNGTLAILTIRLTNTLHTPQQWQHTMADLFIPRTSSGPDYLENLDAEMKDQNSCLLKTGTAANGGLQPGASVTCDLVFDIPASADPATSGSTLGIANFGDDVSNASGPVGIIRVHH